MLRSLGEIGDSEQFPLVVTQRGGGIGTRCPVGRHRACGHAGNEQ